MFAELALVISILCFVGAAGCVYKLQTYKDQTSRILEACRICNELIETSRDVVKFNKELVDENKALRAQLKAKEKENTNA